jgi:hypothetical protein
MIQTGEWVVFAKVRGSADWYLAGVYSRSKYAVEGASQLRTTEYVVCQVHTHVEK